MPVDSALLSILQRSISPDKNELDAAQHYLEEAARTDLPHLMKLLSDILVEESCEPACRIQAGLQLKNFLYAKEANLKVEFQRRWLAIRDLDRQYIKENSLKALATEKTGHSTAAQCVAYMACAELPNNLWPDMMPKLMDNVVNPSSSNRLRLAALEAIGYICQDIDPTILAAFSDGILTAIIHGMKEVQDNLVRLAATNALQNSLEFTKCNFDNENERNYIMQVVCELTQDPDTKLGVAALQCLVKIMSLYYVHMETYMSRALFPITISAMQSSIPEMALQGIEFWSSVCDEEIELSCEAVTSSEQGRPPNQTSKYYAKGALSFIVPILMTVMASQEENIDEDEWNPNKAAGVCLMLLATLTEDAIVPLVIPFVSGNVENPDWRFRDAAIMSFGSILEGPLPSTLKPFVESAMPVIVGLLKDPSVAVRDSSAWTISRICEVLPDVVIMPQHLEQMLDGLITGLQSEPRVATNSCWAIGSLAESAYDAAVKGLSDPTMEPTTYCLSNYFQFLTKALLETSNRADGVQNNLRGAGYTVLMDVLKFSAKDCYSEVQRVTLIIIERLEKMVDMQQQISSQDRAQFNELQSLLCGNLQSVLRKISPEDAPLISDKVMLALLTMLTVNTKAGKSGSEKDNSSGVQEDALLAVSSLIEVLGNNFLKYMDSFLPCLVQCLMSMHDTQVCFNAIGLVADLFRNLSKHMIPHSQGLFELLLAILQNTNVDKTLRPAIIDVFSDFCLALGAEVDPFLIPMTDILQTATQATVDVNDPDMVDYLLQLRSSCLEAYIGILHGLKDDPNTRPQSYEAFMAQTPYVIQFIKHICEDLNITEEIITHSCGLIGDFVAAYGAKMLPLVNNEQISKILGRGRRAKNQRTRNYATWATKEIKKLQNAALGDTPGTLTNSGTPQAINVGQ